MAQQPEEQVARRAVRRLGAGRREQAQEGVDLLVGEARAADLGVGEHADQVVLRRAAARGDDRCEQLAQLARGAGAGLPVHADADQLDREAMEAAVLLDRQPDHRRDHAHREREGQLAHEIRLAARGEGVDVGVHDRPDEIALPAFERAAREGAREQRAVMQVLLAVHLEDRVAHHGAHAPGVAFRGETPRIAQHLVDGVEREHGVDLLQRRHRLGHSRRPLRVAELDAVHRRDRAQRGDPRVRIADRAHALRAVEALERVRFVARLRRGPRASWRTSSSSMDIPPSRSGGAEQTSHGGQSARS